MATRTFCVRYRDRSAYIMENELEQLNPGCLLSDSMIEFFTYRAAVLHRDKRSLFHVLSPLLFTKLNDTGCTDIEDRSLRRHYCNVDFDSVKKWYDENDLFSCPYLIIPVNLNRHWVLTVVCHANALRSCILIFDSCADGGCTHDTIASKLRSWLSCATHHLRDVVKSFNSRNCPAVSIEIEQQENDFDCGVYTIRCCEYFLEMVDDLVCFHAYDACERDEINEMFRSAVFNPSEFRERLKREVKIAFE